MKVYNYDEVTGKFVGESMADESPLEPGVFHIPAFSTPIPVPDFDPAEQEAFFADGIWTLKDIPKEDEAEKLQGTKNLKKALIAQSCGRAICRREMRCFRLRTYLPDRANRPDEPYRKCRIVILPGRDKRLENSANLLR